MSGLAQFQGVGAAAEGLVMGGRLAPEMRLCRGWPLPPVDLEVPVSAADIDSGGEWPPPRCRAAQERLMVYQKLHRGDQTQFVGDPRAVALGTNYYGVLANGLARLGARSLVTPGIEGGGLIVDLTRYGRCYVDASGQALSPITAWRDEDGTTLWVVEPYASVASTDGRPDRCEVLMLDPDGGTMTDHEWSPTGPALAGWGTLGPARDDGQAIDGRWGMGNTLPTEHGWGERIYDPMIPLCVELAARLTDQSEQLNRASAILLLGIAVGDTPGTIGEQLDYHHYGEVTGDTAVPYRNSLRKFLSTDVVWKSETLSSTEYISPDVEHLAHSLAQVEVVVRQLRTVAPIQSAMERDQGEVASGSAQISMSAALAYAAEAAHTEAIGALDMAGVEHDWPVPSLITQNTVGGDAGGETDGDV